LAGAGGIIVPAETKRDIQAHWPIVGDCFNEALDNLLAMRKREGDFMSEDIAGRLDFIEKRLAKLEQYYDRIIFADVFLKVHNISHKQNKSVEILLSIPGDDLIVKKEARSFEKGTDECVQSLERQLKKRKQKQRSLF
jgi:putative sigma-54 modulation protein